MTVRTVYVISPEKVLKLALTYPASTGRNFDEVSLVFCPCLVRVLKKQNNSSTRGVLRIFYQYLYYTEYYL